MCLLISLAGCGSTTPPTEKPGKGSGAKKVAANKERKKGANPLVGRWVIAKAGKQDWSDKVSKDAVIEFHDEDSPGTGKLTVADKKTTSEGYYVYQGRDGFVFEVKFWRKDGSPLGGYGGLMQISKLTDNEIVGDLFTLKRVD